MSHKCVTCDYIINWIEHPAGGWWEHNYPHPDQHDVDAGWKPEQDMDDFGRWYTVAMPTDRGVLLDL